MSEDMLWEITGWSTDGEWVWYTTSDSVHEAMREAFKNKPWFSDRGVKIRAIPNFSKPQPTNLTGNEE